MKKTLSSSKLARALIVLVPIFSILALVFYGAGLSYQSRRSYRAANDAFVFSMLFSFAWNLPFLIWFIRTWRIVPEKFREISTLKAVGLWCIPLYNLYWQFKIFPGLTRAIWRWRQASEQKEQNCGEGFAKILCILWLFIITGPIANILLALWIYLINRALIGLEVEERKTQWLPLLLSFLGIAMMLFGICVGLGTLLGALQMIDHINWNNLRNDDFLRMGLVVLMTTTSIAMIYYGKKIARK